MKASLIVSFVALQCSLPVLAESGSLSPEELLNTTRQAQANEQAQNTLRESGFLSREQELLALKQQLAARRDKLQQSIDALGEQFSANEALLSEKEKKLHLESGSLGELFGVVRQVSKETLAQQQGSVSAIGREPTLAVLDTIAEAKSLPSKAQLYTLWHSFAEQLNSGAQISRIDVPYVEKDGVMHRKSVLRLGAFGLVDENGYLAWSGASHGASPYLVQPESAPELSMLGQAGRLVAFDPSQGKLLEQLALKPTLLQRIEQGGAVGKLILAILLVGLVIGLFQGSFLLISRSQIRSQLKKTDSIGNNALGRVLSVYKYDQSPNVEALELRLYETILDEQQKLERGLSMLKLLAALSPMLGLLGTVTGMIETFQVITQYGNADPKIMAGGISTALVTTVLGLVAAMPLLFIHNVLSSAAESVRTLLEKQGIGLVAQRAEQDRELAAQ